MVIPFENQNYSDVIGSVDAPFINGLAAHFGLATRYYARTHPSLPNYLDLISGSPRSIVTDCTGCETHGDTVVDQLARKNIGWTAYMEGAPGPCYTGVGTARYAKRHNPFVYFPQLRDIPAACRNIIPMSGMAGDLISGRATPFVWAKPDTCNDGHDADCGLPAADRWLAATLPMVMGSNWYRSGGIIILIWDEARDSVAGCCQNASGGHTATLVISGSPGAGSRLDTPVSHAGTLRTLEKLYGLPYLEEAACACSGDLLPLLGR